MNDEIAGGGRKVLLVEDTLADAMLIQAKIVSIYPEIELTHSLSIKDAYALCKKNDYTVILLDLNLPDGFGPQSVAEIRRFQTRAHIIVITGTVNDLIVKHSKKLGADNVIDKADLMKDSFKEKLDQYFLIS